GRYFSIAINGTNIWVAHLNDNDVTKISTDISGNFTVNATLQASDLGSLYANQTIYIGSQANVIVL
ncbi:MAG: hypothetical protein KGH55_02260, partial [Nanoarchaeota archaeon]|nr:hypothetical protein [Nanoarchaeota archaeon]